MSLRPDAVRKHLPASSSFWLAVVGIAACLPSLLWASGPRALPPGRVPADRRLEPLKDLNGYFPFAPPASKAEWERRAEQVRTRMLVALGLWPMPTRTPPKAVIHGAIDQDEYTVEKVFFESFPGFFVTGNLYRPKGRSGRHPGVLCPHGHWSNGRFYDLGPDGVRRQIVQGAERFENGGRSPLQSRCVQLARMGCVVFHYDMIGYADSVQISREIAHRFAKQRPAMNASQRWGLFSPQAEAHLQSVMGMQTYDSMRALDFLIGLPDVDPDRIAMTGASGGGTQTFILSALDPRIAVSMPAVMVSTAMQGGCTCENACLLRIGTGNVEFAALFAPKPLGLTAADDWTREMSTKGFPELQRLYQLLGKPKNVQLHSLTHFKHNYNYVSRAAMYSWMNKHLRLGLPEPIVEEDYPRLTAEQMTVWDAEHPKPEGGEALERDLLRWWHEDTQRQLAAMEPKDPDSLQRYQAFLGQALGVVIGEEIPDAEDVAFEPGDRSARGTYTIQAGLLRNRRLGSELPLVVLQPKDWQGRTTLWLAEEGKSGLFQSDDAPKPAVVRLLDAGAAVVGVDLLYQGEFLADGKPIATTRRVSNPRESAAYTFGYNHTLFAHRVHDVLTAIAFARQQGSTAGQVDLVALAGAGHWAAAARAVARDAVRKAAIDTAGFRFGHVSDLHAPDFLPGGAKYQDLPGMLAVAAPAPLWLAGEGSDAPPAVAAAYRASGQAANLVTFDDRQQKTADAAVAWLLESSR